ncbi:MAG: hypothetical protein QOF82_892 [Frankiales bacterium]|nr:hypothetical protein [Frankiales bacterium]
MRDARAVWWAVAVVLFAGGCAQQATAGSPLSPSPSSSSTAPAPLLACADPTGAQKRLLTSTALGPAATAITGQRVTREFRLEGRFTAAPPPAGYSPPVTAAQATCQLTSLYATNGSAAGPGRLALATVTIDGAGITSRDQPALNSGHNLTDFGPVATYRSRPAWILVTAANNDVSAGCSTAPPSNAPTPTGIQADPYEVFVIDAATGAAALLFEDSYVLCPGFAPTPPSVSEPWQRTSVPWTLRSRAADGSTAQISASWPDCEHYVSEGAVYTKMTSPGPSPPSFTPYPSLQAWADQTHPDTVTIDVNRAVGPDCGPPVAHQLTLHAARVGSRLPATLVHAPVGVETPTF